MSAFLELRDLSVGYAGKTVLRAVNLSVERGELVALIGANGAGKSTLLKTIAGFLKPAAGSPLVAGRRVGDMKKTERAQRIAFLSQGTAADWAFTVSEMTAQGRFHRHGFFGAETAADKAAVEKALISANLAGFADRPVTELSGGEFQRVLIARALAQEAELLLFDEPLNNLDPKFAFLTMELIKSLTRQGLTALISLHNLALAYRYADRLALIARGTITAGTPAQLPEAEVLESVFGVT